MSLYVGNNARSEVSKDVNLDRVDWHREDDDESMLGSVCQVNEEEVHRRDSPTAFKEWKVFLVKVSAAFQQGDLIGRDVHVIPPKEFVSTRPKRHGIAVSQDDYIKKVDNPDAVAYNYRDGEEVLKENEQSHFRKLVGNTNWLAMNNRPDLCFDAMERACNFEKARVKDIKRAGRILRWVR